MKYDILIASLPHMDKDKPSPGPAYLKAFLESKGKKVKTIDGNQIENLDALMITIDQYEFDWLGISVFSYMQVDTALEIGRNFDNVVYGGPGVTKDWTEGNFIRGEGEYALLAFLDGDYSYPGINGNPPQQIRDIGSLPVPDYSDFLEKHKYSQVQVTGSRGCVRDCTFCDISRMWPKFTYVDGYKLAENMHEIRKQTGINVITFTDSLVNGSMKHFRQLCQALSDNPKKVHWNGQFIARKKETFQESDFDNLANSGCSLLTIGIESGSQAVREHMRKKFSNDDIDWFVTNLAKRNIAMKFLLIVGYPTETREDFECTKELIKKYAKWGNRIVLTIEIMRIEPDSPIETDHHDIFEGEGFDWWNGNTTLETRFEWYTELYDYARSLGYLFSPSTIKKREKFTKYVNDPTSVVL